jgi:CheY-like chemotaxis protein
MRDLQCSQCGVSATGHVWGFALLAHGGWSIAPATNPAGAAERAWLCSDCGSHAESIARGLARLSARPPRRERKIQALRVLVVDDHVLMLRSMVRMLAGCETVVTTKAREALALLLRDGAFDVVISDVMMPELSGPDLYARCFAHSPELARRFVFASADPALAGRLIEQTVARIGAAQMPPLLSKPTSRAALMAAVTAIAASAPHRSGTYEIGLPVEEQVGSLSIDPRAEPPSDTSLGQKRSSRF